MWKRKWSDGVLPALTAFGWPSRPQWTLSASLIPAVVTRLQEMQLVEVSKVCATCGNQQGNMGDHSWAAGSNWQVCLTARQPGGFLPLSNLVKIYTQEARGRGNWQAHTKIRIQKFLLKALWPFIQKFAPTKISYYTVTSR